MFPFEFRRLVAGHRLRRTVDRHELELRVERVDDVADCVDHQLVLLFELFEFPLAFLSLRDVDEIAEILLHLAVLADDVRRIVHPDAVAVGRHETIRLVTELLGAVGGVFGDFPGDPLEIVLVDEVCVGNLARRELFGGVAQQVGDVLRDVLDGPALRCVPLEHDRWSLCEHVVFGFQLLLGLAALGDVAGDPHETDERSVLVVDAEGTVADVSHLAVGTDDTVRLVVGVGFDLLADERLPNHLPVVRMNCVDERLWVVVQLLARTPPDLLVGLADELHLVLVGGGNPDDVADALGDVVEEFVTLAELGLALALFAHVSDDADRPRHLAVDADDRDAYLTGHRLAVFGLYLHLQRIDGVLVRVELPPEQLLARFDVAVGEQLRDVFADEFGSLVARQLHGGVVDRDNRSGRVELIDGIPCGVQNRSVPLDVFGSQSPVGAAIDGVLQSFRHQRCRRVGR